MPRAPKNPSESAAVHEQLPPDRDPLPDPNDDEWVADAALEDSLIALDEQLGANAANAQVKIYRQDPRSKKLAYLYTQTVPEFLESGMDTVRDGYGSGDYAVRVYLNGRLHTHRIVSVESARGVVTRLDGVSRAPAGNDFASAIMTAMAQMSAEVQNTVRQIAEQNRPQSMQDRLQELKLLRDVFGSQQPAQPAHGTTIDEFLKMLELAKTLVPREGGSDLAAFADIAKPLIGHLAMAKTAQNPVPIISAPAQPEPSAQPDVVAVGQILRSAMIANADPAPYAEMLLDCFGEEQAAAMLDAPQWFEALCQFIPEAATRRPWCEQLRESVRHALTEDPAPDTTATKPAT